MKIKKILIVGSWAKEQITIKNLKQFGDYTVYAYLDTKNPGIISIADDHKTGSFTDIDAIVQYAQNSNVDLVLITTAAPLNAGLVDALDKENITAFGPDKHAARLESNKAFTRNLLKKYLPHSVPKFRVCASTGEAVEYARTMNWRVAVKPLGLTDGLGVKVYGDQLKNQQEVTDYIHFIIDKAYSGYTQVIVEELLEGEEFTLQCMVNDTALVSTPAVQDFKKLLPQEKGPNTASMGSYSDWNHMLPFLGFADYGKAFDIIRQTLEAYKEETGRICCGFLYGQFMITNHGVKLIEYNFRPGDPEWMNIMCLLEEDIINGIGSVLQGEEARLHFKKHATVCKYIVPPQYPQKLYQILDVNFDEEVIKKMKVDLYHSCGVDESGKLNVGSERGLAFLADAEKITLAHKRIERAIKQIRGSFFHRNDIGTAQLIRKKTNYMKQLHSMKDETLTFDIAKVSEFLEVYDLVRHCPPLESYGPHLYKIMINYFNNTCFVAKKGNRVVGWVMGFISSVKPDTYFLWQIGVDPNEQGIGLGSRLLNFVENDLIKKQCRRIELTIDPENISSQKLFRKNGYRNRSKDEPSPTAIVNGNEAIIDFYGPQRHFMVYEKTLINDCPALPNK
ncbi:MAG: phosphoribosylamine--glycine ligase [bacterium]